MSCEIWKWNNFRWIKKKNKKRQGNEEHKKTKELYDVGRNKCRIIPHSAMISAALYYSNEFFFYGKNEAKANENWCYFELRLTKEAR